MFAPYSTIINIMKSQLGLIKKNIKWIPYELSDGLRKKRIEHSKKMLIFLQNKRLYSWKRIITGDESWILSYYPEKTQWISSEKNPEKKRKVSREKKVMLIVFFSSSGFLSIQFLPEKENFNSTFFNEEILPRYS